MKTLAKKIGIVLMNLSLLGGFVTPSFGVLANENSNTEEFELPAGGIFENSDFYNLENDGQDITVTITDQ